jgi:hypothetical protein
MTHSIDQNQDTSRKEIYSYLQGINIPNFVKEASFEEAELPVASGVTKTAYADETCYFPINSKLRTFISSVFFINKHASIAKIKGKGYVEKVARNLEKAASIFGIQKEISNYGIAMITKKAALETETQVITANLGSDTVELFKISSAQDLQNKAAEFVGKINNFPFAWRRGVASQFLKAAEYFEAEELPDLVLKYAGQYFPDSGAVEAELRRRMERLPANEKQAYSALLTDLPNMESKEDFFKLASVCNHIEKKAGLYEDPKKAKLLGDPVDKFFSLHLDKVAEMLDTVKICGEQFHVDELQKVSNDIYEKAFGFEKPASAEELRDVLPTVPLSDFALFKQLSKISSI